ncbi:glycosyl transferase family 2 [Pseudogulbenkiania ferrooxidans 2002]|uniref:Glycosyl transferase family 2 n=2 Tax=Pseudogulbenkiania ferrooxidans TaxID=549169 RepID=B9Z886_9NEIS|nr:glycosyl transferase family 2 [Pseudogulbenkiania ferrooxidans 2002]
MSQASASSPSQSAPYYVYAPPYRETSGGVRALHYLCHELNLRGQEAYVMQGDTSPTLLTPELTPEIYQAHLGAGREPIVIYPEIIQGNPMRARHVVRYLLNVPGALTNTSLGDLGWSADDLLYVHGYDVLPEGWQAGLLQVPLVDTRVYHADGVDDGERHGHLVWLNRYLNKGGEPWPLTAEATEISFRVPNRSPAELAALYRGAELLFTYEHSTACFEALLCGCPVVYLPNPIMLEKPMHNYLGSDGVAWGAGEEEIARAKATVYRVQEQYKATQAQFGEELVAFIETTQGHVREAGNTPSQSMASATQVEKRKPRIGVLSQDPPDSACFRLRLGDPLAVLADAIEVHYWRYTASVMVDGQFPFASDQDFIDAMDMFIVQRSALHPSTDELVQRLLQSGKPLVYELDDWLPSLPMSHPQYAEFKPSFSRIKNMLPRFHLVTASTPVLAEIVRAYNPNVAVLPNYLSAARLVEPQLDDQAATVTIGFAGTATHRQDLARIGSALARLARDYDGKVSFVFWGSIPPQMEGVPNVRFVNGGVEYQGYLPKLGSLKIDIGIAALEESEFNAGKSDIKWLEYSSVGAVSVLSDVPAYRHIKELDLGVVLPPDDEDAWYEALADLVENAAKRCALATRARDYLLRGRLLEGQIDHFVQAWNLVLPEALRIVLPPSLATPPLDSVGGGDLTVLRQYRTWLQNHHFREVHAEQLAERMVLAWSSRPVFNLVTVVSRQEQNRLADTVDALQQQLYPHWRLIVLADWEAPDPAFQEHEQLGWLQLDTLDDPDLLARAVNSVAAEVPADWLMWLPVGFRLVPQALVRFGEAIHMHPEWSALYCDSDIVSPMGERFKPRFRPDFAPEYLRSMDYIGDAVAVATSALLERGGFEAYPGAYWFDLLLWLFEQHGPQSIGHVDDMLLSLPPVKPHPLTLPAQRVALENHTRRLGLDVELGDGYLEGTFHFNLRVQGEPLVSVIVPNRDKLEVLEPCVESLFEGSRYQNFELIIVDNRSEEPETREYYRDICSRWPDRVRIVAYDAPFNFSAQCNLGVAEARGSYVLLLNNDTEVVLDTWLERLLAWAQQPGVGAVGARLTYPEVGLIQHAGIVLGLPGGLRSVADHVFEGEDIFSPGYMNRLLTGQNYSAVTAACLMVAKEHYLAVGGMDDTALTVLFNDVDLCLKLQAAGLRNVYNPFAVMVHHHARSIGRRTSDPRVALEAAVREYDELNTMMARWLPQLARDPAYNRHLALNSRKMMLETSRAASWDPAIPGRRRVLGLPVSGGSGEYRVCMPLNALQAAGRLDGDILQPSGSSGLHVLSVVEMARQAPDTLLLHTAIGDGLVEAMKNYRQFLPEMRIVFGMDDLVGAIPEKSSFSRHWKKVFPDARSRLRKALALSDTLIVSTDPLAEHCRGMIDDIVVIPNRLQKSRWDGLSSLRGTGKKPRVGWVGAAQHRGDLELIVEVVKQTADEVDWVFMGMCLAELRPYVAEVHPFVAFDLYPEKMASLNLDLAIAPLEVSPFNEAKSNLRLLEYGVLGWPVVCTDIYPYQTGGAPVCRVANEVSGWVEAIRQRVHDLPAAYRAGDQLRDWVRQHYMLEEHLHDWQRALC